jgi:hypothetical protein
VGGAVLCRDAGSSPIWEDYWDNGLELVRLWWVPLSVKEGSGLRVLGCEIRVVGDPMWLET